MSTRDCDRDADDEPMTIEDLMSELNPDDELDHDTMDAFEKGSADFLGTTDQLGVGLASNPFDHETDAELYEAWLDGWEDQRIELIVGHLHEAVDAASVGAMQIADAELTKVLMMIERRSPGATKHLQLVIVNTNPSISTKLLS